jgi:hypothetical protein
MAERVLESNRRIWFRTGKQNEVEAKSGEQ